MKILKHFCQTNNCDPIRRHCVTLHGNLNAPATIVFVHGFGSDQTIWSEVATAFHNDYKIIMLDLAGTGKSDSQAYSKEINRYLTLRGYVEDLIKIGEALVLENAILIGHSVGGMIGLLASNRRPDIFSKLVLIGTSPRYLDDVGYHGGLTEKAIDDIHLEMNSNYAIWAQSYASLAMGNPERPRLTQYFANNLQRMPAARAASFLLTILASDYRSDVAKVTVPTLIIQSREDIAVPIEVAEYLHEHIQNSQLSLIEAKGHFPHLSSPEKVIEALKNFGL